MTREKIDTLILSDIHFGSELCNAELLFEVMSKFKFRRLILNGDIFDHLNLEFEEKTRHLRDGETPRVKKHRLKKNHLKALSFISGLSKPENDCEVVWIEGNHDEGISHIFSSLIGATVYNEYLWDFGGKKCLAIHGDQFDQYKTIGEIDYYNSGTMQSDIGSCITLCEQGVRIHFFEDDGGKAKVIDVAQPARNGRMYI